MPGPYSAGSIFVSVVPSFKDNQNDIAREMKRQGREGAQAYSDEFSKKIASDLPKATEKAARANRQSTERAGADQGEQYSTAFRKSLGNGLKDASRQLDRLGEDGGKGLHIPVDVDEKHFRNSFNALIRDIALTEADIKVGADVDEAMHDIDRLIGQLRRLRDASTNPEVRTDMSSALGSMEDSIARARKNAQLNPEGPPEQPSRQLGTFDATARNRVQSALASVPPVEVDADTTPAMHKIVEFRTDAFRLLDDLQADVKLDGDDTIARMRALMATLEGVIETADPEVEVDANYNAAGALAQLKGWVNAVSPQEVQIEPEMGYFRKRLAEATKAAGEALPEVAVDADTTPAQEKMAELRAELMKLSGDVRVGMDLEDARAKSKELQRELGRLRKENVDIEVDVDAARAIIELEAVERAADDAEKELNRSSRGADDGANSFRAFSGRVLGIAALGPVAIPVIGAIGISVAALAPIAVAGAAGLGVFALATHGVMDAVKAMSDVQDNAGKDAKAYADGVRNASRSVRDAESGLADARRNAADSAVSAQERVDTAVERVEGAERNLTSAQTDQQRAQERLTQARKNASEQLVDLQMQVRGGALAERRAYMQLAESEVAYANALADPGATRTEREQLLLDLDEQKFSLDSVLLSNQRLNEQQQETNAKGVEGSDEVVSAQDAVASANERVADAQDALAKAVADIAKAQEAQQRAAADSARSIETAQLRLADAQEDYADAVAKTSTSQDALATSMAKLSPAGQAFAEYLFSLKPLLSNLQGIAAEGILPGVQDWMSSIISTYGPQFTSTVDGMSNVIGGMFSNWADELQTPAWADFFDMMESKGPVFLDQMGQVLTNVGTGVAALLTAFAPAAEDFGNGMVGFSEDFSNWAQGLSETQGFQDFMDWWERVGPKVIAFFEALGSAIGNIAIALAPYGEDLMSLFTSILNWIGGMDPSTLGSIAVAIVGIVVAFQALVGLNALISGFSAIWGLASAAMAVFEGTAIGTAAVLGGIAGIVAIVIGAFVLLAIGLYLLYQNNEAFRSIVDATWQGIKNVVGVVVDWFQKYVMPVIMTVLQAIGDFFTWLWHDIIEPIFVVWQIAWGVLWDFMVAMWVKFGHPMFDLIMEIVGELWQVIQPILILIGLAFEFLWSTIAALWVAVGKPIFDAFIQIVTWLWLYVIDPVLQLIAGAFGWLFEVIDSTWKTVGKPVFDLIEAVLDALVGVFQGSFDGIKGIWDALMEVFMAPIRFVVETVLNKGFIGGINHIASIFTGEEHWIPDIPTGWLDTPFTGAPSGPGSMRAGTGYATGGRIAGNSPTPHADNIPIWATAGEFMQPYEATSYYGLDIMEAMRRRLIPREMFSSIGLAKGGPVYSSGKEEDGGGWLSRAFNVVRHPLDALENIITGAAGNLGDTQIGKMLLDIPMGLAKKGIDSLLGNVEMRGAARDSTTPTYTGGRDAVRSIFQAVAAQHGWGSGPQWTALDSLEMGEAGYNPNAQNPTSTAYGLGQFLNSTWGGVGGSKTSDPALQAEYMMRYIARSYGDPISAFSKWSSRSPHWYSEGGLIGDPMAGMLGPLLFDQGGQLDPGLSLVMNATRQPEAILNPGQLENIQRIADSGGRSAPVIGSLTVPYAGADVFEVIDEVDHWATVASRSGGKYDD